MFNAILPAVRTAAPIVGRAGLQGATFVGKTVVCQMVALTITGAVFTTAGAVHGQVSRMRDRRAATRQSRLDQRLREIARIQSGEAYYADMVGA